MSNYDNWGQPRPSLRQAAPPQGWYQPAPAAAPQRKRKVWPWVLLAVVLILAGCGIGSVALIGGGAAAVHTAATSRKADVKITSCEAGPYGTIEVAYSITSHQATSTDYIVQVQVLAGTEIVGEADGITSNVPAGGTASGKAVGTIDSPDRTGITCSVVSA